METGRAEEFLLQPLSDHGDLGRNAEGHKSVKDDIAYGSINLGDKKFPTNEDDVAISPVGPILASESDTVFPGKETCSPKSSLNVDNEESSSGETNNNLSFGAKIFRTTALNLAYIAVTLNLGIVGPSLIDLGILTGAKTSELSIVFTARGVLAIVGSLVLGPIFDKINRYLVLGAALFMDFLFLATVPLCRSLAVLLVSLSPPEFFNGAIGMGTHLVCIDLWGDKSGQGLQLLNLISVVGFTLAPLLVKPFLAPDNPQLNGNNASIGKANVSPIFEVIDINSLTTIEESWTPHDGFYHQVSNNRTMPLGEGEVSKPEVLRSETHVQYAYLLMAIYALVVSVLFAVIFCVDRCKLFLSITEDEEKHDPKLQNSKGFILKVSMLFFIFNVFYAGIEIGYAGLLMTFSVRFLGWDKSAGANVTALLQASNALVTAFAIMFSRFVRPTVILAVDMIVVTLALLMLSLTVEKTPMILWACSAALGAGYATIMPSTFTWANSFMEVTGKFSSFYWCGFFSGFMALPALSGYLFNEVHAMWYPYTMLIYGISMGIIFLLLCFLVHKRNEQFREDSAIAETKSN